MKIEATRSALRDMADSRGESAGSDLNTPSTGTTSLWVDDMSQGSKNKVSSETNEPAAEMQTIPSMEIIEAGNGDTCAAAPVVERGSTVELPNSSEGGRTASNMTWARQ